MQGSGGGLNRLSRHRYAGAKIAQTTDLQKLFKGQSRKVANTVAL
jgi:hypothetical protein